MGGGTYSSLAYTEMARGRKARTGVASFSHAAAIRSGTVAAATHKRVDPASIKDSITGKRESRDSDEHNNSNAIAVMFDVTGSMGHAPVVLQEKLSKLMTNLLSKGVIDDPQVLFGAVGDANYDRSPFQVGQFESSVEMDEDLDKFHLEGGGGGGNHESYELALFFLSRLTSIDCFEKRGKRGFAFIIADEASYPEARKDQIARLFGKDFGLQEDIPVAQLAKEVQEKYETFIILPTRASGYGTMNKPFWNDLFPQRVLELDDVDLVCELIVTTIGIAEGVIEEADEFADDLDMSSGDVTSVGTALSTYIATKGKGALATVAGGAIAKSETPDGVELV